jgi:primase-polymerase (primpol)-like protein
LDAAAETVRAEEAEGVGIVLGEGLVGIDLDRCRDVQTGDIEPWASEIIHSLDSYTEVSPSGSGVHILVRGTLPPGGRRKGNIEMYPDGRYFTVTGRHVEGAPTAIEERTTELAALHARTFDDRRGRATAQQPASPALVGLKSAVLNSQDAALLACARAAKNGDQFARLWTGDTSRYPSQSEADLALCSLLAFWCERDEGRVDRLFRHSGLMRPKWDERRGERTYGERTLAVATTTCMETEEPNPPESDDAPESEGRDFTDDGLALALGDEWPDARYVAAWGQWLFYDGSVWRVDESLRHFTRARAFLRQKADELDEEAAGEVDLK